MAVFGRDYIRVYNESQKVRKVKPYKYQRLVFYTGKKLCSMFTSE